MLLLLQTAISCRTAAGRRARRRRRREEAEEAHDDEIRIRVDGSGPKLRTHSEHCKCIPRWMFDHSTRERYENDSSHLMTSAPDGGGWRCCGWLSFEVSLFGRGLASSRRFLRETEAVSFKKMTMSGISDVRPSVVHPPARPNAALLIPFRHPGKQSKHISNLMQAANHSCTGASKVCLFVQAGRAGPQIRLAPGAAAVCRRG